MGFWLPGSRPRAVRASCAGVNQMNETRGEKEGKFMAYVISDACVSCGTCEGECPVSAIHQGENQYEIDADTCISCGTCAGACPVGAISEG